MIDRGESNVKIVKKVSTQSLKDFLLLETLIRINSLINRVLYDISELEIMILKKVFDDFEKERKKALLFSTRMKYYNNYQRQININITFDWLVTQIK